MNTATHPPCQTSGLGRLARLFAFVGLALGLFLGGTGARALPAEPPAWRRELDAARLAEATVALLPPPQNAEASRRLDELYGQLARKYPGEPAVRKAAGDHFWQAGEPGAAVAEWQAAQTLDPSDAETASALGSARLRDGQVRLAREQFQRAVDARPEVARYHFDLANVLYLFRHELTGTPALPDEAAVTREALQHFRRASDLAAGNVEFARAYAETFYGLHDPDWTQAFDAWSRVRTLSATAPDYANSHLARVSLSLGKPEQAEEYLALIHGPGFAPVKATLHRQASEMRDRAVKSPAVP